MTWNKTSLRKLILTTQVRNIDWLTAWLTDWLTPSISQGLVSEKEASGWIFNGECNTLAGQVYQPQVRWKQLVYLDIYTNKHAYKCAYIYICIHIYTCISIYLSIYLFIYLSFFLPFSFFLSKAIHLYSACLLHMHWNLDKAKGLSTRLCMPDWCSQDTGNTYACIICYPPSRWGSSRFLQLELKANSLKWYSSSETLGNRSRLSAWSPTPEARQ